MSILTESRLYRWTRDEYNRLAALDFFAGRRVELIEGQIVDRGPMGSAHATAIALVARALERAFGAGSFVRWQMPLVVGELSEPEPDVAVITGDVRDYADRHPTTAALLVEVADSSLAHDRQTKGGLYAMADVPEYWIVNLVDRTLEVYRSPALDRSGGRGARYTDGRTYRSDESIVPLAAQSAVGVADLLP